MRPGTPGFVGERLQEACEARQISPSALAELLGISKQAVYSYVNSAATPSPEVMARISEILRLPAVFFLEREVPQADGPVFFRSLKATTKALRLQARQLLRWAAELSERLGEDLELPNVNFPEPFRGDFRSLTPEDIEECASRVRAHWRMGQGPISNLVRLLETAGAVVARVEFGADELDGLSARFGGRPVILLASDKASAARSRFDAAHELGHLVLHSGVKREDAEDPTVFNELERQAHRFAGAFLFPAQAFASECTSLSLDSFRVLKERWKVSIRMMIKRAAQLGFISETVERRLYVNATRRWGAGREPLDDVLPPEKPQLLAEAIRLLVEDRGLEATMAGQRLVITDVATLAGVSVEQLAGKEAPIVKFQPPQTQEHSTLRTGDPAPVIPLHR